MIPIQWINYNRQISISAHKELLLLHKEMKGNREGKFNAENRQIWKVERKCCRSSRSAKGETGDEGWITDLGPSLMSHTMYCNS